MTYLTERQRDVLDYIRRRLDRDGVAPTLQEIADAFRFASTASAQKHVGLLEKKGFLRREKHQKRGLVLAASDRSREPDGELPLLGVVAAGSPIESVEQSETVTVPPELLRSGDHFALRVRGDSMVEDGIHDGDVVIVQRAARVADGDVVVALIADEVTLKRLYRRAPDRVRLQPANATLAPVDLPADQVTVQGVVVGLLRRY